MSHRNFKRDHEILTAFEAGRTPEQLAEDHALGVGRIHAIIAAERCKRAVSPAPFYRTLRADQPIRSAGV
jgi:hypothetical protein